MHLSLAALWITILRHSNKRLVARLENQTKLWSDISRKVTVNFANKSETHCCDGKKWLNLTRTYPGPGPGVPGGAVVAGAGQLRLGPGANAQRLVDLRDGEHHHQGRNIEIQINSELWTWLKIFRMVMSILSKWFGRSFILKKTTWICWLFGEAQKRRAVNSEDVATYQKFCPVLIWNTFYVSCLESITVRQAPAPLRDFPSKHKD